MVVLAPLFSLLATAATAQASAKPPKSGRYLAKTSEGSPISFVVSAGRKTITALASSLGYDGRCGQGGGPTFSFTFPAITITAHGHFTAATTGTDNATRGTIRVTGVISKTSSRRMILEPTPFFACSGANAKLSAYSATFAASTR